jgi:hypothetical protein
LIFTYLLLGRDEDLLYTSWSPEQDSNDNSFPGKKRYEYHGNFKVIIGIIATLGLSLLSMT